MLAPAYTKQFERDIQRMEKRGKNLAKLKIIIRSIVVEEALDAKNGRLKVSHLEVELMR